MTIARTGGVSTRMIGPRIALIGVVAVLGGCGSTDEPGGRRAASAAGDCLAAWNGAGNEENRRRIADEEFEVARVSEFVQIADFADGGSPDGRSEGCSYLFHDDSRYPSLSGTSGSGGIRWGIPAEISGPWSAAQEANTDDSARVLADGRLVEQGPARPPAGAPPVVAGGLEGPPPAWVETDRGSLWLGFSTFCWKSTCADYLAPSCDDGRHVPRIVVGRGELVTVHLGFEPRELALTSFVDSERADQQRLAASDEPVLRIERDAAKAGGGASYVACFELAS